jgi:hypothetical protein
VRLTWIDFGNKFKSNFVNLQIGVKLNNRVLVISAILCIMVLVFAGFSQAQSITSGVRPGMTFCYTVSSYWSSSDSYSSIPWELAVFNQTAYVEVRISEVNSTHISTTTFYYFVDGTAADPDKGSVALYTGVSSGFVGIIGANLNVGDRIHPNGENTLTILDTSTRYYDNYARSINHVRIIDDNQADGYRGTRDLYFDKATGILVEQVDYVETLSSPTSVSRITWKIAHVSGVDNWTISGFTFPTPLPPSNTGKRSITTFYLPIAISSLLAIAAIAIIIYKKK